MPPLDSNELLDLLRKAVEKVRHATLRAEQAEARMQAMSRKAEEIMAGVEGELDEALTGRFEAERCADATAQTLAQVREDLGRSEERTRVAEAAAAEAQTSLREAQARILRAAEALTGPAAHTPYANGADTGEPTAAVH